jgi:hypothetical protein
MGVEMTQQYIAGELSLRLGQLQAAARDQDRATQLARLRYEAETIPRSLRSVAARALGLGDRLCWDSLGRGDASAFGRQAAICAELWEFGLSAHLFEEHSTLE